MSPKFHLFFLLACSCATVAQNGAAIYQSRCARCHDSPIGRTPGMDSLHAMSSTAILSALETGAMRTQAKDLNPQERMAVSLYLTGGLSKPGAVPPAPQSAYCVEGANWAGDASASSDWNGFGAGLTNARFQDRDAAGISLSDVPKLRLRWAFGLGDVSNARGQPVVVGGRLFTGTEAGKLYSVNAKTGCLYWVFDADAPIRSGVIVGALGQPKTGSAVFFGDANANAYAVDTLTGKLVWKTHLEEHYAAVITAAPNLYEGELYFGVSSFEEFTGSLPSYQCCTFRGSVVAVEAGSGKPVWKTYTIGSAARPTKKTRTGVQRWGPSGAAVWSTPTVDLKRDAIYVSTGDNYSDPTTRTSDAVLALDRRTGKMLWSRQMTANDAYTIDCASSVRTNCPDSNGPDFDFGQPPILISLSNGKRALVIGQKSGVAHALDPDQQGKVLWQTRLGKGGPLGGIQWGSAADKQYMYVALSDIGFKELKDPADPARLKTELDPDSGGGLFALQLLTGKKIWSATPPSCGGRKNCSPAQSAAVTAIPGVVFSGSVDGHLRAYASATGELIWDYDTAREYDGINGQKLHGGAIDGSGAAVSGGMVYVYSGYGEFGGMPGNALLAFSVEGR